MSKGRKDRAVPIPQEVMEVLKYYTESRFKEGRGPTDYLFDGQDNFKGEKKDQYSKASLRAVLRRACMKAQISKRVKFHTLRHSRATHYHNSSVMTLRDIADVLGHSDTKTTEIYLHTQNSDLKKKIAMASRIIESEVSPIIPAATAVIPMNEIAEKTIYEISFNNRLLKIVAQNGKIIEAPEGAKWSIGVVLDKAMSWFTRKGAQINKQLA